MPSSRYIFGTLPFYSVLIVSGMILAIFLASREEKRLGLPKDTVLDLALFLIPISVICARAYYVIFSWDAFRSEPLSVFAVWEGGLAIYGGLIGGLVTVLVFAYIRRISPLTLFDMIVPGVALAQALGRWGNFFNMEAYGLPVENPAKVTCKYVCIFTTVQPHRWGCTVWSDGGVHFTPTPLSCITYRNSTAVKRWSCFLFMRLVCRYLRDKTIRQDSAGYRLHPV